MVSGIRLDEREAFYMEESHRCYGCGAETKDLCKRCLTRYCDECSPKHVDCKPSFMHRMPDLTDEQVVQFMKEHESLKPLLRDTLQATAESGLEWIVRKGPCYLFVPDSLVKYWVPIELFKGEDLSGILEETEDLIAFGRTRSVYAWWPGGRAGKELGWNIQPSEESILTNMILVTEKLAHS